MSLPNRYSTMMQIQPSSCGFDDRLSPYETFRIFMDLANTQAEQTSIDQRRLMEKGLFWMITRTRVVFRRRPSMQEMVVGATWPCKPRSHTVNRRYSISDSGGAIIEGLSEWVIFDNATQNLHNLEGVYPQDFVFCPDEISFNDFPRLRPLLDSYTVKGTYTVSSSDIDMGLHMNNTIYIRAMLGMFSIKELEEMDIREISILYKNPAHHADSLELRMRNVNGGIEAGFYFPDGRPAVLTLIVTGDGEGDCNAG